MILETDAHKLHVLFIPKWYPAGPDLQFGIFIKKHAQAVALFCRLSVLYPAAAYGKYQPGDTEVVNTGNLTEVYTYYRHRSGTGLFTRTGNLWRYYAAYRKGKLLLYEKAGKPGLIHAHVFLRPGLLALKEKLLKGIPYVFSEHWTGFVDGSYAKKSWLYRLLCRMAANQANAITVVSEGLQKAMKSCDLGNEVYRIIPNVLDFTLKSGNSHLTRETVNILTAADLVDKNKNISGLLRVLANVQRSGHSFIFHLVGGGPDEWRLKTLADELQFIENTVVFHGRQNNEYVLEQLQKTDFVIVNSNVETFSVFTAEAIASGKPVIATRCGGPEYMINKGNGMIIEPRDSGGLEEAILKMMEIYSTFNARQMSDEIRTRFNAEVVGQQFHDLYMQILSISKT